MKTYDIHSLLEKNKKKVQLSSGIAENFSIWKELFDETGESPCLEDAFYAGYVLGNNVTLRERVLSIRRNKRLIDNVFGDDK